ncbi:MAG: WecB/TagA/CpsF family glycosyltransferase [Bacillota bacterium]|nr:WecB/TagA/CpsF family glycosyltransferase [Bacillota bacterium]
MDRKSNSTTKGGHSIVRILGSPVNSLTLEETVQALGSAWAEDRQRVAHVVTANAEMLYQSSKDKELAEIIEAAEIVTADGAGVVLASRILGSPVPERVAGFDLMVECLKEASRTSVPIYFLGAEPHILNKAVANARELFPGLNVVGSHHGYFRDGEDESILDEIYSLKPCLLLAAMGVPRQEKWIYRNKKKLPPCVAMGVGGSFDVLAGKSRRAPLWMQRAGLEWFYRVIKEPYRLGRTAVLPAFLFAVLNQAAHRK